MFAQYMTKTQNLLHFFLNVTQFYRGIQKDSSIGAQIRAAYDTLMNAGVVDGIVSLLYLNERAII